MGGRRGRYDGLNRQTWRSASSTGANPEAQYSYDTGGTNGVGHLSVELFNQSGTLGKGQYSYSYEARGRTTGRTETLDSSSYGYNDTNQLTTVLYFGGTTLNAQYSTAGWLTNVTHRETGTRT